MVYAFIYKMIEYIFIFLKFILKSESFAITELSGVIYIFIVVNFKVVAIPLIDASELVFMVRGKYTYIYISNIHFSHFS